MSDVLDPTKPWCCTIDLAIPQSSVGRSPRPFPWRLPFPIQVRYRFVAPSSSWASCRQSMPPTPTWTSALQRCRFRDPSRPGHAGHHVHWDVPGSQLWLIDHPALRRARHNCDTGHSTGRATRSILPPRRQAAGPPSAWSQPFQSTHERPRRWCDAGALGRQSVPASQKAGAERTRVRRFPWSARCRNCAGRAAVPDGRSGTIAHPVRPNEREPSVPWSASVMGSDTAAVAAAVL